ncbi:hypothetical protein L1887_06990 [Cichorium endivia]|nr:hypothetical protein L1887_06990 [Cichorium endivia]
MEEHPNKIIIRTDFNKITIKSPNIDNTSKMTAESSESDTKSYVDVLQHNLSNTPNSDKASLEKLKVNQEESNSLNDSLSDSSPRKSLQRGKGQNLIKNGVKPTLNRKDIRSPRCHTRFEQKNHFYTHRKPNAKSTFITSNHTTKPTPSAPQQYIHKGLLPTQNIKQVHYRQLRTSLPCLWHQKLAHLNFRYMNQLVTGEMVRGMPLLKFDNENLCAACALGKQKKKPHKSITDSSITHPLELLHIDLCGPSTVASLNHKKYILVIVDDFTCFTWVFFLRLNSYTFLELRNFIVSIELKVKLPVRRIRSDNGTEFNNRQIEEFLASKGIEHNFSTLYTPQQNGMVERRNRTLVEAARSMLNFANLPLTFWTEAIATACFVLNRRTRVIEESFDIEFDDQYLCRKQAQGILYVMEADIPVGHQPIQTIEIDYDLLFDPRETATHAEDIHSPEAIQQLISDFGPSTSTSCESTIPTNQVRTSNNNSTFEGEPLLPSQVQQVQGEPPLPAQVEGELSLLTHVDGIPQSEGDHQHSEDERNNSSADASNDAPIFIFEADEEISGEESHIQDITLENPDFIQDIVPPESDPAMIPRLHKWTRNHPPNQIIGNPSSGIQTRSKKYIQDECHFATYISKF